MQLSLAINQSLLSLRKMNITCTEPFRIPFAGKIDVCCFDKTGTLTSENFIVQGIAGLVSGSTVDLIPTKNIMEMYPDTGYVLAGCQSLVHVNGQVYMYI